MVKRRVMMAAFIFNIFVSPAVNREGRSGAIPDPFDEVLKQRPAAKSILNVRIVPETTTIRPRELLLVNGMTQVLSIPISIENHSKTPITTTIAHEWYGGLWPRTDLFIAVKKVGVMNEVWVQNPGYLVGELGSNDSFMKLGKGERRSLDFRLNWPGTGSVRAEPLIKESQPGRYWVRFLLFFEGDNKLEQFIEMPEIQVETLKP